MDSFDMSISGNDRSGQAQDAGGNVGVGDLSGNLGSPGSLSFASGGNVTASDVAFAAGISAGVGTLATTGNPWAATAAFLGVWGLPATYANMVNGWDILQHAQIGPGATFDAGVAAPQYDPSVFSISQGQQ